MSTARKMSTGTSNNGTDDNASMLPKLLYARRRFKNKIKLEAESEGEMKIGIPDYASVPPIPIQYPSNRHPTTFRPSVDEIVWYQCYHELYDQYYYFNDRTKCSQWDVPFEPFVPYARRGSVSNQPVKSASYHQKTRSHRQETKALRHADSKSKLSTRHITKRERKEAAIKNLTEAIGCDEEQAKSVVQRCNNDVNKAAEMLLQLTTPKQKNANTQGSKFILPDEFYCSICLEVMKEPMCAADGFTYCKKCIKTWLKKRNTSPKTNEKLRNKELVPNYALRSMILYTEQSNCY